MVVGSLKTGRAARSFGRSVGSPSVLHGGCATRNEFPLVETTLRAKRRALRAYRQLRSRPSPPLVCVRSPPYLQLVTGVRLAPPGSFLVEATFAPAQPPFMVTELLGEKTNLKQKQPSLRSIGAPHPADVLYHCSILCVRSHTDTHSHHTLTCTPWRVVLPCVSRLHTVSLSRYA